MKKGLKKHYDEFSVCALNDVKRKFDKWRQATPFGRRRISEKLWNEAVGLTAFFSISAISISLSLDYVGLKRRVFATGTGTTSIEAAHELPEKSSEVICSSSANNSKGSNSVFADKFIEITPGECFDMASSSRFPVAEISSENGMILRLFSQDIAGIIRAFTRS